MYATAHRVSRAGQSGINTFLHLHGQAFSWPQDARNLPETNSGELKGQWIQLKPGGNQVHSYLDVLAPDGTPRSVLTQALQTLLWDLPERLNPTIFTFGPVTLRFGVQLGLEPKRELELVSLIEAIQPALSAP